jgi:hypothetical protein
MSNVKDNEVDNNKKFYQTSGGYSSYQRPKVTITESIQNQKDIQEILEGFEELEPEQLDELPLNTLLRYITYDKKTGREWFRFGGWLCKIDPEYLVLNGKNSTRFCVQRTIKDDTDTIIYNTRFFKKSEKEEDDKKNPDISYYEQALEKTLSVIDEQKIIIQKQEEELKKLKKKLKSLRIE